MSVLDASAVLAFLLREPGQDRVAAHLANGCISTVNVSEVIGRFVGLGHASAEVTRGVIALRLQWIDFDADLARAAAELVPISRPLGLSLADRACLALGLIRHEEVVTADRAWSQLSLSVPVVLIR